MNFIGNPIQRAEILFNQTKHIINKSEALTAAYRIVRVLDLHKTLQNCACWTLLGELIYELSDFFVCLNSIEVIEFDESFFSFNVKTTDDFFVYKFSNLTSYHVHFIYKLNNKYNINHS